MKKLLVLGGTLISCEIVRAAKKMGLYVIVVDYNNKELSPAKQIADEDFCISIMDVDSVVELIHREKIDGVITGFADILLVPYAEICEKAGLPCYGSKKAFEIFTNKKIYKKMCRDFNIPTIEEYSVEDIAIQNIAYPVLVKPTDNSGSRGITICNNYDELIKAYEYAQCNSKMSEVLVEPYMDERECTVFLVFIDGNYYVSVIGNRHVRSLGDGAIPLPVGYTYPASITEKYIHECFPNMCKMLKSLDIKNGMMFIQCKVKDSVCYAYDIGYRLTGSLEYINLLETCGYNPMEMMINYAINGKMVEKDISDRIDPFLNGKYAYNVSCLVKKGIIRKVNGIDKVKKDNSVDEVILGHLEGEEITETMIGRLAQIVVRVLGHTTDKDQIYKCMKYVHDSLSVISCSGEEMLLAGIDESDLSGGEI